MEQWRIEKAEMVKRYHQQNLQLPTVKEVFEAMERHELKAYYQPKYDAATNRMNSAEALVRWVREDETVIMPSEEMVDQMPDEMRRPMMLLVRGKKK